MFLHEFIQTVQVSKSMRSECFQTSYEKSQFTTKLSPLWRRMSRSYRCSYHNCTGTNFEQSPVGVECYGLIIEPQNTLQMAILVKFMSHNKVVKRGHSGVIIIDGKLVMCAIMKAKQPRQFYGGLNNNLSYAF